MLSGYDYTLALETAKVTGRVLCLFAANPTPVDALEWVLQRMGLSSSHRRVVVEEFLALAKCTWGLEGGGRQGVVVDTTDSACHAGPAWRLLVSW